MRNKKSLLGFGLVALILILSVGYAFVSDVYPTITGTATTAESDLKVSFTGDVVPEGNATGTAVTDGLTATISVTNLANINDQASVTYTLKNNETDLDATLSKNEITIEDADGNDISDYFEVTTDVDTTPKTIAANGGTETVKVTVKLIKIPVSDAESTAQITVKLTAHGVQPSN